MLLVVDANVLIDFVTADESVLTLAVRHLGPVFVPRDVFDEVDQLSEETCARLELTVVDGTLEQLVEAGRSRGGLSFADRMCLILARDNGWTCVSNDGRLRRACGDVGVPVKRGLRLLLDLLGADALTDEIALSVARAIVAENPWIGSGVLEAFTDEVLGRGSA